MNHLSSSPEVKSQSPREAKLNTKKMPRSRSLPATNRPRRPKGILRCTSVDQSLRRTYGTEPVGTTTRIHFANVEIREYARTIGDNPSCSSGPPVSISWEYAEAICLPLDAYEGSRPPRRSNLEMILPREFRQRMLKRDWEVTQTQIAAAVRANIKIKNQRRTTVNNLGKSTKIEETVEGLSKGLMRGIFLGKSTDYQVKKLEKQMEAVEQARKQLVSEEKVTEDDCDDYEVEETLPIEMDGDNGPEMTHP